MNKWLVTPSTNTLLGGVIPHPAKITHSSGVPVPFFAEGDRNVQRKRHKKLTRISGVPKFLKVTATQPTRAALRCVT